VTRTPPSRRTRKARGKGPGGAELEPAAAEKSGSVGDLKGRPGVSARAGRGTAAVPVGPSSYPRSPGGL
jgi:hypothetical protein